MAGGVALLVSLLLLLGTGATTVLAFRRQAHQVKQLAEVFPGEKWAAREPAELGLDAVALKRMSAAVGGDGFVSRYGYQVHAWGNPGRKRNFGSAGKVFFSYLLFQAVEEGRLASADDPVSLHVPALNALNPELGYPDREFTWRQMATMTSCYGVAEAPGTAFSYSDYQVMLLGETLMKRIYGANWEKVFEREFVRPLNMQDKWGIVPLRDSQEMGWRPMVSLRDMNRFGLHMMRGGKWDEQQVIEKHHVQTILGSPHPLEFPNTRAQEVAMLEGQGSFGGHVHEENHDGAFSYFWWLNHERGAEGRLWPALPADAYGAIGYGGKCLLMVIPSQQLVVTWVTPDVKQTRHGGAGKVWVNARMEELMEGLPGRRK